MKQAWRIEPVYWLALLIPVAAIVQFFIGTTTLPETADGLFHTHRIYAMSQLMQEGDLYPRWIPWFHLGYGYPVFNYYAPLGTWLGGLLGVIGFSSPLAFQSITALSWLTGSAGMTALARRFLPDAAALAAAALWVYAPVRFHEYWNQGSLPHILATALAPWVFYTLLRLIEQPSRRHAVGFGVSVALLTLAHQPTTVLMAFYAGIAGGLLWLIYRDRVRVFVYGVLGVVIALGLAAVLLLPLVAELDAIVINDVPTGNIPAILAANVVPLDEVFQQPGPLDRSDLSVAIPHTYGLLAGFLSVIGVAALMLRGKPGVALLLAFGAVTGVFLLLPASLGLWETIPLLDQLRFPWRVMRVGIVPLALLGGAALLLIPERWRTSAAAGVIVLALMTALPLMISTGHTVDFTDQTAADLIRYERDRAAYGGTSYNEFKPKWGQSVPTDIPPDLDKYAQTPTQLFIQDMTDITAVRDDANCWHIEADTSASLTLRQFYFPGWQATLDGQPLSLEPEPQYGRLQLTVPAAADERLCVWYAGTPVQHLSELVTVLAVIVTALLWATGTPSPDVSRHATLSPRAVAGFAALLLAAGLFSRAMTTPPSWVQRASPPDAPYAMAATAPTTFARGYELLGYTLHDEAVERGGTFTLTLYWRPHPGTQGVDYAPVVQLLDLAGTQAWGVVELPYVGTNPYNHTPEQFISQRVTVQVFDDAPPYVGRLGVRLREGGQWIPAADSDAVQIILPDIIPITGNTASTPARPLSYVIGDVITMQSVDIRRDSELIYLDVIWRFEDALPAAQVTTFVHGLDEHGELMAQDDRPVFGGMYPPQYWRSGQTLQETYILPDDSRITTLAMGMYTPGARLPVVRDGQRVADDRILFSMTE